MLHLTDETLARLVDEAASEDEAAHLANCDRCGAELWALRQQTQGLAALPDLGAPQGGWGRVRAQLARAGTISSREPRRTFAPRVALQAVAGILLFLIGLASGGAFFGHEPAAAPVSTAASSSEAEERLRAAEAAYLAALTAYSEASGSAHAVDPLNRLAALEGIVLTTRAALAEAPADPLINGYHLSALGQREAILRQIDATAQEDNWF